MPNYVASLYEAHKLFVNNNFKEANIIYTKLIDIDKQHQDIYIIFAHICIVALNDKDTAKYLFANLLINGKNDTTKGVSTLEILLDQQLSIHTIIFEHFFLAFDIVSSIDNIFHLYYSELYTINRQHNLSIPYIIPTTETELLKLIEILSTSQYKDDIDFYLDYLAYIFNYDNQKIEFYEQMEKNYIENRT